MNLLMKQFINKIRVKIEHVFSVLKRFKILFTKYNNHLKRLYFKILNIDFCLQLHRGKEL